MKGSDKQDSTPRLSDDDLAESYSLGHPLSQQARGEVSPSAEPPRAVQKRSVRFDRRERRPYFVR